ncbi:MAG: DUF1178 family protein [Erythrobacter sp.]|uniref:DUF1178 family protein n=1 Tax=Erythrobacter sp. TaxID=1042 RepID=UPI0026336446|nr:DUF1178 family protein [Erythrobacter sp.]MDJ0977778.1 DUF1178 family protein [Erythrobacter sp.]
MIVFDLHCEHGHRFEGWFGSSGDFEDQLSRGLLACPECGTAKVSKAPMAPAVPVKGNAAPTAVPRVSAPVASDEAAPDAPLANREMPAEVQRAMAKLAEAQAKALKDSTWVGGDFAKQSREMHYGERDEGPIHGQASLKEAKELLDEGVPVAPLPFPAAPPEKLN